LAAALVMSALAGRASPDERRRMRFVWSFLGLALLLLPIAGALRARAHPAHGEVQLAILIFEALASRGIAAAFLFVWLLPRIHLRAPPILRDVASAGASLVAVFALLSKAGFNVSGLIMTSTVLAAVVGLSLQDTLGNIMAGLALQVDASIHVGDWV